MSGILMLADDQWLAYQQQNSRGRNAIFCASPNKRTKRESLDPLFCVRRGRLPRPIVAVGRILQQVILGQDEAWRKYQTELGAATEKDWQTQAAAVLQNSRDNFDGKILAIVLTEFSFFPQPILPNEVGLDDTGWANKKNVPHEPTRLLLDRLVTTPPRNKNDGADDGVEEVDLTIGISATSAQPSSDGPSLGTLSEESYYRDSPERLETIIPRHNKLSNDLCDWLKSVHRIRARQEQQRIDVRFKLHGHDVIAELKVCAYVGTRKSIREALGQLLEYNHYPARTQANPWLIVIDEPPSMDDKCFIEKLREERRLPVCIGWRTESGFTFHPPWPATTA